MSVEQSIEFTSEPKNWGNMQGIWQIITPLDNPEVSHRSIHFGRRVKAYENQVLTREENETLFIYEVTNNFSVRTREPSSEETESFLKAALETLTDNPFTQKLQGHLKTNPK